MLPPAEEPDLNATHEVLVHDWSIVPVSREHGDFGREALLAALKDRVLYLMQHNFNRLMTAMYILDVEEARFKAAMAISGLDNAAAALAEVILEREEQKVLTRQKYRNIYNIDVLD